MELDYCPLLFCLCFFFFFRTADDDFFQVINMQQITYKDVPFFYQEREGATIGIIVIQEVGMRHQQIAYDTDTILIHRIETLYFIETPTHTQETET